jgi:hypothetical protein
MNYNLDTKEGMSNAVRWTESMIASIADGGLWIVPRSMSTVQLDKKARKADIVSFMPDPSLGRVLREMGYTVTERSM